MDFWLELQSRLKKKKKSPPLEQACIPIGKRSVTVVVSMRITLHTLCIWTLSYTLVALFRKAGNLWTVAPCWRKYVNRKGFLRVCSLVSVPVHSLCFLGFGEDVTSQVLPPSTVSATCWHASLPQLSRHSRTINQKKLFLLEVAFRHGSLSQNKK